LGTRGRVRTIVAGVKAGGRPTMRGRDEQLGWTRVVLDCSSRLLVSICQSGWPLQEGEDGNGLMGFGVNLVLFLYW
jgi:hypothetical protein